MSLAFSNDFLFRSTKDKDLQVVGVLELVTSGNCGKRKQTSSPEWIAKPGKLFLCLSEHGTNDK